MANVIFIVILCSQTWLVASADMSLKVFSFVTSEFDHVKAIYFRSLQEIKHVLK